jgi:hypothetical protein
MQKKSRKRSRRDWGTVSNFAIPTEENRVKPNDTAWLGQDSKLYLHEYDLEASSLSPCVYKMDYIIYSP